MPDHYAILELSPGATKEQIKAAFKRLALKYHPDRNPNNPYAEEYFKKINSAYHALMNQISKDKLSFSSQEEVFQHRQNYTYQAPDYEPYVNSYDPANFVSKKMQFRIKVLAVVVLLVLSGGALAFQYYVYSLNAHKYYDKALVFLKEGQKTAALIKVNQALFYDKQFADAYLLRAQINSEYFKNYVMALQDYEEGIRLSNKEMITADIYFRMGWCYFKMYDYLPAVEMMDKAIDLDKGQAEYYAYRGVAKFKSGKQFDDACDDLEKGKNYRLEDTEYLVKTNCKD